MLQNWGSEIVNHCFSPKTYSIQIISEHKPTKNDAFRKQHILHCLLYKLLSIKDILYYI